MSLNIIKHEYNIVPGAKYLPNSNGELRNYPLINVNRDLSGLPLNYSASPCILVSVLEVSVPFGLVKTPSLPASYSLLTSEYWDVDCWLIYIKVIKILRSSCKSEPDISIITEDSILPGPAKETSNFHNYLWNLCDRGKNSILFYREAEIKGRTLSLISLYMWTDPGMDIEVKSVLL